MSAKQLKRMPAYKEWGIVLLIVLGATLSIGLIGKMWYWQTATTCDSLEGWGVNQKVSTSMTSSQVHGATTSNSKCYERLAINVGNSNVHYNVRYADSVPTQGEGSSLSLNGNAKMQIDFMGASYNDEGQTVYPAVIKQTLPGIKISGYSVIKDAKWGGSFEGQSTIGLGVENKLPFRVLTEDNQIIIDIAKQ